MDEKKAEINEIVKAISFEESNKRIRLTDDGVEFEFENNKENMTKAFQRMSGCSDKKASNSILSGVANSLVTKTSSEIDSLNIAFAFMEDIAPQDALEGMLAAQMVATHSLAMKMAGLASHPAQSTAMTAQCITQSTKLMNTFNNQLTTLQKYRSKGTQTIQVQHVNVEAGGQAIVGNVRGVE
ncbi:MAG: hypothetical protein KBT88_16100 [Gammaproteobacteria bacterium]|nr:hypothetical protein [Gammaproteobacteria bacterium]MBQ0841305.1 hypothetical protein [Gammaproteobacteria bacterium]